MVVSEKRLAANRANARRSTGPRTSAGKATVARNALVHGLCSRNAVLPDEDFAEYKRFGQRMLNDLRPDGALQEELALEIVNLSWKLRRVPEVEAELLTTEHGRRSYNDDADWEDVEDDDEIWEGDDEQVDEKLANIPLPANRVICKMILSKKARDLSPDSPLWLLDRYAVRIERARALALRMLLTLQKRQARQEDSADDFDDADDDEIVGDVVDALPESGEAGAAIDDAPLQNKPTGDAPGDGAQGVVNTTDAMFDASPGPAGG